MPQVIPPGFPTPEVITNKQQLIDHFAIGCKPAREWRIGMEHEKFIYSAQDHRRLPYDTDQGIRTLLAGFQAFGWLPIFEHGNLVALKHPTQTASLTLEPGGQFELSGTPLPTLHDVTHELVEHLQQTSQILASLGGVMLPLGFEPKWTRSDIPWMPKGRYKIMRNYMPKVGSLGLDMMTRTCTVQVNLDYSDEADMVKKMRIGMALQSIVTALFASSPFTDGGPNQYQSYRMRVWQDTDPDRSGVLPFVFEDSMSFERYVDYLLDIPMYFAYRSGSYVDASGLSFRDFLKGKLSVLPGEYPTMSDWFDQTTIAFPDVRLKPFIEMRGADSGPPPLLKALPAFWVGLLYDASTLDQVGEMIKDWSVDSILALNREVPRTGLKTLFNKRTVQEWAIDLVNLSTQGLKNRRVFNKKNEDESIYLAPLMTIAESGQTYSDLLLNKFNGKWGRDIDRIFDPEISKDGLEIS